MDTVDTARNDGAARADSGGPRRLHIVAGLVAVVLGAVHFLLTRGSLDRLVVGSRDALDTTLLLAVWHSFTATIFLFGIALIAIAWASRPVARTVAFLAAIHFGYVTVILASASARELGSPFGLAPVFGLGIAALLSLGAALRTR